MTTDPYVLARQWVVSAVQAASASTRVTTQLDPSRGLPQLVINNVRTMTVMNSDGRIEPALTTLMISVVAFGKGGDMADFAGAWSAIQPVVAAIAPFQRWTAPSGTEAAENAQSGVITRAFDPDTNMATQTLTVSLLVRSGLTAH